ncbi:MAG: hypothetical protein BWX66_01927 [Deltaproteobacteria bacterium ADurb.Bin058]|nr:MAG: hypothetical protein BWX66_01927 [Deltaproteobacteria bacterium ADurb.Bin058]
MANLARPAPVAANWPSRWFNPAIDASRVSTVPPSCVAAYRSFCRASTPTPCALAKFRIASTPANCFDAQTAAPVVAPARAVAIRADCLTTVFSPALNLARGSSDPLNENFVTTSLTTAIYRLLCTFST